GQHGRRRDSSRGAGADRRWARRRLLREGDVLMSTKQLRVTFLLLAGAAAAAPACTPGDFDKALENAPVRSIGVPSGYRSPDVGRVVRQLALPAGKPAVVARFLIAGTEFPSLAVVDLDAAGKAKVYTVPDTELADLRGESNAPAKSVVEMEDKQILIGAP